MTVLFNWLSHSSIIDAKDSQSSSWLSVRAGVPQKSVLEPLCFLIYMNYLTRRLSPDVKLFADDTSLFSIANCVNTSVSTLNSDLLKIQADIYHFFQQFWN